VQTARLILFALAAFLVQTFCFLIIPVLNVLFTSLPLKESREIIAPTQIDAVVLKKIETKQQKEIKSLTTSLKVPKSTLQSGSLSRGFSMDLSIAGVSEGGSGVAVGIPSAQTKNVVYSPGEVDVSATEIRSAPVEYPQRALREKRGGRVDLLLVVETDGSVSHLELISEEPSGYGFGQAAMAAMKEYLFKPAQLDGVPVRQRYSKEFHFDPP